MRYLKVLFGRMTIVTLAVVMQVLIFAAALTWLNSYYTVFNVIFTVLSVIVVLTIVNRDMTTESKIPWLILVLLAPLLGTVVYIFFADNHLTHRQRVFMKQVQEESARHICHDPRADVLLEKDGGLYAGQAAYIRNTTGQGAFTATQTRFFADGEAFWRDLLTELARAESFIFMEFFIVEEGVMWDAILQILKQKAAQGVEVRFMYDDIGSIGKVDKDYYLTLRRMGINCRKFNPFRPVVTAMHNNRDHRKIIVIDGKVGYAGGINLADEYINHTHPFGHWKDTMVKLCGCGTDGLTRMFLQNFDHQTLSITPFERYLRRCATQYDDAGVVVPYGDGPHPFYREYIAENVYLHMISQARRYLWITTPYLIIDSRIEGALCAAAQRGVDVRIVTPHIPDKKTVFLMTRSHYPKLQQAGVKILEYTPGFIHAKQVLCDDACAVVGSINFDYRSLVHHYECGVWMWQTACIPDIKKDFEELFAVCTDMKDLKQNWLTRLLCSFGAAFSPLL